MSSRPERWQLLREEAENHVQKRASRNALLAIRKLIRSKRHLEDPELFFEISDWYRRLGMHERGFRFVRLDEAPRRTPAAGSFEMKRLLWSARFLNLLGATEYAIRLLRELPLRSAEDNRIAGTIYLAGFEHQKALGYFRKMLALDRAPKSYRSRVNLLNLADCCHGTGDVEQALRLARKVLDSSGEPLLRGMALQAQAEYLARSRDCAGALPLLDQAQVLFPPGDQSPDFAIFLKWKGYCLARLGKVEEGNLLLDQAFAIFRRHRLRPEAWLDVLRLKADLGILDVEENRALLRYPGLAPGFRAQLPLPSDGDSGLASGRPALEIDLARDEVRELGRIQLGIPIETRAFAYLGLACPWGIPPARIKCLLWPDQIHAYPQLESRLHQLLRRLRNERGIAVTIAEGLVRIDSADAYREIRVNDGPRTHPSFLASRSAAFQRSDVEKYYGLSQTQAWTRIQEWAARGWIRRVREGRGTAYEPSVQTPASGLP